MSIRPDKWIRRKSTPPTHSIAARAGSSDIASLAWEGITHTKDQLEDLCNRFWAAPLKADHPLVRDFKPMIEPFEYGQVRRMGQEGLQKLDDLCDDMGDLEAAVFQAKNPNIDKVISYGTSSYGYDVRCGNKFKVFTNLHNQIVDPKNFNDKIFHDHEGDFCIIPPNSFALAQTVEYFRIPRNVLTICLGKSTYARCGIIVNVTPLEPEWEGQVTLEFSNTTNLPAKIYANEGVAQMLFLESDEACETSYKDRGGKYQGQTGVTVPRM
ncbi:Deoxycytidine triphosphate deaminase [compost metagenome]